MHLQINQVRSDRKVYRYVRLVQSYRRDDGLPMKKVVANLGALDEPVIAALKTALQAARTGKTVVVADEVGTQMVALSVAQSLAYLDVAVLWALWNELGLRTLLARVLPLRRQEVSSADVVFALVAQRCLAPGSKLSAERWVPTTALPELLGVAPGALNNARIHRVLEGLDEASERLQEELAHWAHARWGRTGAWFLDVTDAFFEGRSCALAERTRTKAGLPHRYKVGVVLLCNERGVPLRWLVVPGKRADHDSMGAMVEAVQDCLWMGKAPLVCDRAMGRAASVARLLRSGLRFLTAVPRNEFESHEVDLDIPHRCFVDYEPACERAPADAAVSDLAKARAAFEADVAQVGAQAARVGMEPVSETLYVLDLGLGTCPMDEAAHRWVGPGDIDPETLVGGGSMLAWARIFARVLAAGAAKNRAELARRTGLSRARVTEIMNLLTLAPAVQDEVLAGTYGPVSEHRLRDVLRRPGADAQRAALAAYAQEEASQPSAHPMRPRKLRITQTRPVRRVVYFNPAMFVTQRLQERKRQQQLDAFVGALNARLRSPHCRRDAPAIRFDVMERLSRDHALRLYDLHLEECQHAGTGRAYYQISLTRDEAEWRRRRRYHGFVLLVGHAELPHTAAALARLYRAKDTVEQDFRLLKDVTALRPIYHHTDIKVRAHVTLCMLALLLQRVLAGRLEAAGRAMTASVSLETLGPCRLNRHEPNDLLDFDYSVTRPTAEQEALLAALGLSSLVRDQKLASRLCPR